MMLNQISLMEKIKEDAVIDIFSRDKLERLHFFIILFYCSIEIKSHFMMSLGHPQGEELISIFCLYCHLKRVTYSKSAMY